MNQNFWSRTESCQTINHIIVELRYDLRRRVETKLSAEQFEIYINKGIERPFSGKYHDYKEPGIYECACCGNDLFSSGTKFDSGTEWSSFLGDLKRENIRGNR